MDVNPEDRVVRFREERGRIACILASQIRGVGRLRVFRTRSLVGNEADAGGRQGIRHGTRV